MGPSSPADPITEESIVASTATVTITGTPAVVAKMLELLHSAPGSAEVQVRGEPADGDNVLPFERQIAGT
jgi:hypothetical protein